jgi:cell division protein FtsB
VWIYWVIIGLGAFFVVHLTRGAYSLWRAGDRVVQVEEKVAKLTAEKAELAKEAEERLSAEYAERVIRDQLSMARPGEIVLIMPELTPIATPPALLQPTPEIDEEDLPVWRQWVEVFW